MKNILIKIKKIIPNKLINLFVFFIPFIKNGEIDLTIKNAQMYHQSLPPKVKTLIKLILIWSKFIKINEIKIAKIQYIKISIPNLKKLFNLSLLLKELKYPEININNGTGQTISKTKILKNQLSNIVKLLLKILPSEWYWW